MPPADRPALLAALLIAAACASPPPATRDEVTAALERYQRAARAVDPDGIAAFFTATGTLFEPGIPPITGPDAIAAFMGSFPGVQVHSATATPDTIEVYGATAYIWGSYFEHLAFPGQPESRQHGRFVMQWVRQRGGSWLIERYYRIPLPPSPSPP